MNLKVKINEDFKAAFKAGEKLKKDCLGMLKTKITEAEKKDGKELDDNGILNIISTYSKQLQQTIDALTKAGQGNVELAINTVLEQKILSEYLPKQLTEDEIVDICKSVAEDVIAPPNMMLGVLMKHFKENYNGQYNSAVLKGIVDRLLKVN